MEAEILVVASWDRHWNKCWPNGPLGTCADFTSTSELPFASFSERVLVVNVSHEKDFYANEYTGDIYFHTNSFAQRLVLPQGKKVNLGLGYSSMSCSGSL